jgi:beta-alanine degradation protein BauB
MRKLIVGMLLGALITTIAFAFSSRPVPAQDPVQLAPQIYRVLLENSHVRVIDYRLKPGEKEPMHSHPFGAIVYFLTDTKIRTTLPSGKIAESSNKAGDVLWRDPVTHAGENIGRAEAHSLIIEPKKSL